MTDDDLFDADPVSLDVQLAPPGRAIFNAQVAPELAGLAVRGVTADNRKSLSSRFSYHGTDARFVVVAGAQEKRLVDLALAYGLTYCGDRRLALVLPRAWAFPTLQRVPWLKSELRPTVYVYDPGKPAKVERVSVSRQEALKAVRIKAGDSPEADLRKAAAPLHLGDRGTWVDALVDWAASHPDLDPAHRANARSWQCRGQRVLTLSRSSGKKLSIVSGIHYSKAGERPAPRVLTSAHGFTPALFEDIKLEVEAAMGLRLKMKQKFHKADEHWLQAVLRRDPELVGLEPPALREVPAWRPKGAPASSAAWGRGFIDLVGLDAHAEMRLVETKLATNNDEMFMLQGLDYYVWAQVYADALRSRLGAAHKAEAVVHYVVGADPTTGSAKVSRFAQAQANALDMPWRAQVVRGWYTRPSPPAGGASAQLLPPSKLPS